MRSARLLSNLLSPRVLFIGWLHCAASVAADGHSAADISFFEKRVRPILVARCYECHSTSSTKLRGGLHLDSRTSLYRGGDTGPAVDSTAPEKSLLIEAIRYDSPQIQMPPAGKLPDTEIATLIEWVRRGAPFPPANSTAAATSSAAKSLEQGKNHWAFQPLRRNQPLAVDRGTWAHWPQRRIDEYGLSAQLAHELHPAPAAERAALIRRAHFDLLGLPPTPADVAEFVGDESPDAFARVVDRLLASPHYGERWARYWLDLVRYCDVPESWREGTAQAWLYRDWVVQALNEDRPFDQFVRQQFAADLLPAADPRDNAALGLLGLSPTYWKELKLDHLVIKQVVAEEWEERIEAIGATFLGLTLACARCHDHKFDPVTMRDYYGMAGVLASIQLDEKPIIPAEPAAAARQARDQLKELQKQLDPLTAKVAATPEEQAKIADLRQRIDQLRLTPHLATPVAFGVIDASLHVLPDGVTRTKLDYKPGVAQDVAIHIRGNAAKEAVVVPRQFIAVLSTSSPRTLQTGSGRLELAETIVTDAAALTARVFVNRIWRHHFGRGIVNTPSNFGLQGDRPSHPELLDDLAARLIDNGWSLKWLHREVMLSAVYQQSSHFSSTADPDNIWLARMPLRRLDVEAWRDAQLAATGELDGRIGGAAQDLADIANRRRTLYGTIKRRELTDLLRLHDFPDPVAHSASREPTTTPLQQLFVLNSPFIRARSVALQRRLHGEPCADDTSRVALAYQVLFGRAVLPEEVAAAQEFLASVSGEGVSRDEAWTQLAQVWLGSNELLFVE